MGIKRGVLVCAILIVLIVACVSSFLFLRPPRSSPEQKAEADLLAYLKGDLKAEFVPKALEARRGLQVDGTIAESSHTFYGAKWERSYRNFYAVTQNNLANGQIMKVSWIGMPLASYNGSIEQFAEQVVTEFAVAGHGSLTCRHVISYYLNYTICESFWQDATGKHGIGVKEVFPGVGHVFSCMIPLGSEIYALESCEE
jgi:hypothetical protein